MAVMEGNLEVDIESGNFPLEPESSISTSSESDTIMTRACDGFSNFDGLRGEGSEESSSFVPNSGGVICKDVNVTIEKNSGIECRDHLAFEEKGYSKQKKPYSNKHSKPPRPPKGPLLNASDMMLVKKISEIAVKKRERIRALKKMKGAKSSSYGCTIVAMVITVLFFIFIIIQGLCSRGGIQVGFQGSPEPSVANKGLISVQFYSKPPTNEISGPINRYPNSDEPTSGSGPRVEEGRDVQSGVFQG